MVSVNAPVGSIASVSGSLDGTQARVDILSLKRSGSTMVVLILRVTNTGTAKLGLE